MTWNIPRLYLCFPAFRQRSLPALFFCAMAIAATPAMGSPEIRTISEDAFDRLMRDGSAELTVVSFMTAWCGPCRVELPHLIRLKRKFGDQGFRLLGVSLDPKPEALRPLLQEQKANFPIYWAGRAPIERYGIQGIPLLFLVQEDQIVDRIVGLHPPAELEKRVRRLLSDVPDEMPEPTEKEAPPPGAFSP